MNLKDIALHALAAVGILMPVWHTVKLLRRRLVRDKELDQSTDKLIGVYKELVNNDEFFRKKLSDDFTEKERLLKQDMQKLSDEIQAHREDVLFLEKLAYIEWRILNEAAELAPERSLGVLNAAIDAGARLLPLLFPSGEVDVKLLEKAVAVRTAEDCEALEGPYRILAVSHLKNHAVAEAACALPTVLDIHIYARQLLLERPDDEPEKILQKASKMAVKKPYLIPREVLKG